MQHPKYGLINEIQALGCLQCGKFFLSDETDEEHMTPWEVGTFDINALC
ncbi:MAG: hypothetical protein HQM14_06380 [SAR324 cluster bacterium]|nr:hypothetical protein [SAR324 cluster bacterium]